MDFGLVLLHSGAGVDGERILAAASAAEDAGLDSVWVYDHLLTPVRVDSTYPYAPDGVYHESADDPFYDPLALIGVLTARTRRVRVGAEVFVAPYRHPIVLAKALATFERFAPGRIVCGVGAGWMQEEFDAVGVPFARRGARLAEYVGALRAVWSGEPNAFDGEFYRWPEAGFLPAPSAPIPIVLGGHADVALRRAARIADGFAAIAGPGETGSPAEFAARLGRIRGHVEERRARPGGVPDRRLRGAARAGARAGPGAAARRAARGARGACRGARRRRRDRDPAHARRRPGRDRRDARALRRGRATADRRGLSARPARDATARAPCRP